jgi:hypothetical protein
MLLWHEGLQNKYPAAGRPLEKNIIDSQSVNFLVKTYQALTIFCIVLNEEN